MTPLRYGLLSVASAALLAGTLWFQRSNPTVIQARDIVELRQAVIERCLATQYLPESTNTAAFVYQVFQMGEATTNTYTYGTPDGVRTGFVQHAQAVAVTNIWTNRWGGTLRVSPPMGPVVVTNYSYSNRVEATYTEIELVRPEWWNSYYESHFDWREWAEEVEVTRTNSGAFPMCSVVYGDVVDTYSWDMRMVRVFDYHDLVGHDAVLNVGLCGVDWYLNDHSGRRGVLQYFVWPDRYPEEADATVSQVTWTITMADATNLFRQAGSTNVAPTWAYFNEFQARNASNEYVQEYYNTPAVPRLSHTNIVTVTNLTLVITNIITTNAVTGVITNAGGVTTNAAVVTTTNTVYRYPTLSTNMLNQRYKVLEKLRRTDCTDRARWETNGCGMFAVEGMDSYGYWLSNYTAYVGYFQDGEPVDTNTLPANTWTLDFSSDAASYDDFKVMLGGDGYHGPHWTRTSETGGPMVSVVCHSYSNEYKREIAEWGPIWLARDVTNVGYRVQIKIRQAIPSVTVLNRQIESLADYWVHSRVRTADELGGNSYMYGDYVPMQILVSPPPMQFDDCGLPMQQDQWRKAYSQTEFAAQSNVVLAAYLPDPFTGIPWPDDPATATNIASASDWGDYYYNGNDVGQYSFSMVVRSAARGFIIDGKAAAALWNFQYCTNSL